MGRCVGGCRVGRRTGEPRARGQVKGGRAGDRWADRCWVGGRTVKILAGTEWMDDQVESGWAFTPKLGF